MEKLRVGNEEIRYFVRKNVDSKYVQLTFRPTLVLEVSIPPSGRVDVGTILRKKMHWIERTYGEIAATRRIFDGKHVLYKGTRYSIVFKRRGQPRIGSGRIMLPLQGDDGPQEALKRWMTLQTNRFVKGTD